MFADLVRRGISHPNAVAFVKRAVVASDEPDKELDVPVWGIVLLYVSFFIAVVGTGLVSSSRLSKQPPRLSQP